jgi:hypothetical protein
MDGKRAEREKKQNPQNPQRYKITALEGPWPQMIQEHLSLSPILELYIFFLPFPLLASLGVIRYV